MAVAVPALMAVAMPVRALMLDGPAEHKAAVAPGSAMVKGTVTSFGSVPLPEVTVRGINEKGETIAMAKTGPNGEFAMEVPAAAGKVVVVPQGGEPATAVLKAGATTHVDGVVPASQIVGNAGPGWWAGLSTTSKVAIIAVPAAAAVGGTAYAISNSSGGSSREASPVAP